MKTYTVWNNLSIGVNERCIKNTDDNYIGIETGNVYSKDKHYYSVQILAKIISVDKENETGMLHLCDGNNFERKSKYIGGIVTLEEAHLSDGLRIYRCLELNEYFSENEIELLKENK